MKKSFWDVAHTELVQQFLHEGLKGNASRASPIVNPHKKFLGNIMRDTAL